MNLLRKSAKEDDDGEGNGAPAFMVYYCSVMILLLAFFIVLQAFAEERHEEMFYRGRGSFISALDAFGLGTLSPDLSRNPSRKIAPQYKPEEGADREPTDQRIDPDTEAARKIMMELAREMELEHVEGATGYRVEIATPVEYRPGKTALTEEEKRILKRVGPRLEGRIRAHGFVVRISSAMPGGPEDQVGQRVDEVLKLATMVRSTLISGMSPRGRSMAEQHIYSFVRNDGDGRAANGETRNFNLVLTQPYTD